MSDKLKAGTICYDEQGRKMKYVTREGEGHIVRPLLIGQTWDGDEGDEYEGSPVVVGQLFREPPVEVYAERIRRLQDEAESWRQKAEAARDEHAVALTDLKALGKLTPYQGLIDLMLGHATHAIEVDSWQVHDIASKRAKFSFELRRDGVISFNIFMTLMRDHASSTRVVLARSEEEARDRAKTYLQERLSKPDWKTAIHLFRVEKLREAGVELPAEIEEHVRQLCINKAMSAYVQSRSDVRRNERGMQQAIADAAKDGVDLEALVKQRDAEALAKKEAAA